MGIFAAVGAAADLAGAIIAGNLPNEDVGQIDATPSPSATASPTPDESPAPTSSASPEPTASPSPAPPTAVATPAPQAAISGVAAGRHGGHGGRPRPSDRAEAGLFRALGSFDGNAAIWSSSDGASWSRATLPFPATWQDRDVGFVYVDEIAAVGDRLVAIGTIGINDYLEVIVWESTDGTSWSEVDTGGFRQSA